MKQAWSVSLSLVSAPFNASLTLHNCDCRSDKKNDGDGGHQALSHAGAEAVALRQRLEETEVMREARRRGKSQDHEGDDCGQPSFRSNSQIREIIPPMTPTLIQKSR